MPVSAQRPKPARPLLALAPAIGAVIALALIALSVARNPEALKGDGVRLAWLNVVVLLAYALAALRAWLFSSTRLIAALRPAAIAGSILGAVLIANHLTELFVPNRNFALVIAPVFLAIALFAATGSAARQRSGSILMAMAAGVWCAMVGVLILLCAGFVIAFLLQARVELWLQDAYAASGSGDPAAYVVYNTLQAASEGLLRMPVAGLFIGFLGALSNASIARRPRPVALALFSAAIIGFIAGAAALWHANALARAARPPFILAGLLLVCAALAIAHPAWSAIRQSTQSAKALR